MELTWRWAVVVAGVGVAGAAELGVVAGDGPAPQSIFSPLCVTSSLHRSRAQTGPAQYYVLM